MMLKIADFKKGQRAYILERNLGYNRPPEIIETTGWKKICPCVVFRQSI